MNHKIKCFLAVAIMLMVCVPGTLTAEDRVQTDDWRFGAQLYLWYPAIEGNSATGNSFDIQADALIDNLDFAFMTTVGAYKSKWSFIADVIYLDVSNDTNATITNVIGNPVNVNTDVKLEGWIVTPLVGYTFLQREKFKLDFLAGARYLWLKTELDLAVTADMGSVERKKSRSGDQWGGIVGLRGQIDLTENWYLPFYLDVGTGDSNMTWQLLGSVGYRFKYLDVVAGYRYLQWDFDDNDVFDDLSIHGPYMGVRFWF